MNGKASRRSGDDKRGKLEPLGWRTLSTWLLFDLTSDI